MSESRYQVPAGQMFIESAIRRFWSRVERTDDCWWWRGRLRGVGPYGEVMVRRKRMGAHRFSWMLANNSEVPPGQLVCHSCDNPKCVNPAHLFIGEPKANTTDAYTKGRLVMGSQSPHAKLSEDDVRTIRAAIRNGESLRSLAGQYGVSKGQIGRIKLRECWRHIE